MPSLLITGASGRIGSLIRPLLAREGREIRLLDVAAPPGPAHPGEVVLTGSVTDAALVEKACAGVDLVVHLGGYASERPWEQMLDVNIDGTRTVLEKAHLQGVRRVLLAGSTHVVGMTPIAEVGGEAMPAPRPDTYYGVSKAAAEALGSLYADAYGMTIVTARIGTVDATPIHERALSTWLSPADAVRLVEAVLALEAPGHHIVWGVSRNTRGWFSLTAGEAIGFRPQDDAEVYAGAFPTTALPPDARVGGVWGGPDWKVGGSW
ncbi:NAD-dependent epimerase/dehydratase family protein [Paractinoplanes atraurantiacus]|uniref:NAD dependent epimerase/dehydratase family protein n=1 Tax=Paractinoplanes atraurantiacus TaxID=1036182 RepID=A0A285JX97_9ACTN|nr:NAD(P)-dependent oxidoreductase [Actinoplanes atraurantiacus]SNY64935.1 NAD dependent epimerase/dehydratase family protein [Actinoplanes atraurantiacus]